MNDLDLMEKFRVDAAPPSPGVLAGARSDMFRAASPPRGSRRRWAWGLAPVAALAVAVAVAVVVARPQEGVEQDPAPASEAVRVLRLAATEARREPPLVARPDQFLFFESRVAGSGMGVEGHPDRPDRLHQGRRHTARAISAARLAGRALRSRGDHSRHRPR